MKQESKQSDRCDKTPQTSRCPWRSIDDRNRAVCAYRWSVAVRSFADCSGSRAGHLLSKTVAFSLERTVAAGAEQVLFLRLAGRMNGELTLVSFCNGVML